MMQGEITNISIRGIVSAVPQNKVDNDKYIDLFSERRIKKQIDLTGIEKRRVTKEGQKASDLATIAADDLLDRLGWERNSIDVLVFVTQSEDLSRPSSAFLIQDRLKLGNDCLVYDINMGCSGYIGGLTTVCSILQQTKGRGLLLVGESNAQAGEDIDRNQLLEGDAAAATALEYCLHAEPMLFSHYSDGSRAHLLYKNNKGMSYMDGNGVLLFGLDTVAEEIMKFMAEYNIAADEVDNYVFHQAQKMIVEGIVQETRIPADKVLMSCKDFGNTSSASIPLTLCVNADQRGKKKVLMCGYGIGLSCGIAYVKLDFSSVFPLIETDYVYDDRTKFGL